MTYTRGVKLIITGTFKRADGSLIDPDSVSFEYKVGSGATQSASPAKDSTGVYSVTLDLDAPGTWFYRMWSTGNGKAAIERSFTVESGAFA